MSDFSTGYVSPYPESVKHRFEMKFIKGNPDECWEWLASRNNKGYGKMAIDRNGKLEYSHRLSYRLYKGDIPDGLVVTHSCDNKGCVNPNHLSIGTYSENSLSASKNGLLKNRAYRYGEENGASKYSDKTIAHVKQLLSQGLKQVRIAEMTGVSPAHVSKIARNATRQKKQRSDKGKSYTFATHSQGVGDSRKTITDALKQHIIELSKQGMSQHQIASKLGISQCSVSKALAKSNPSGH